MKCFCTTLNIEAENKRSIARIPDCKLRKYDNIFIQSSSQMSIFIRPDPIPHPDRCQPGLDAGHFLQVRHQAQPGRTAVVKLVPSETRRLELSTQSSSQISTSASSPTAQCSIASGQSLIITALHREQQMKNMWGRKVVLRSNSGINRCIGVCYFWTTVLFFFVHCALIKNWGGANQSVRFYWDKGKKNTSTSLYK